MPDKMTALEKIDAIRGIMEKMVEATGVEKAGYIVFAVDALNKLKSDVLVMEEQLRDLQKNQNGETMSPD